VVDACHFAYVWLSKRQRAILELSVAARSSDVNDQLDPETSDNETMRQDVQILVKSQIGRDALLARSTRDQIGVVIALEKVLASLERRRQRYVKLLESQSSAESRNTKMTVEPDL
jgi:hypothetical protein